MKIGIMQPYFMPYIGYWQLIGAVDKFIILDDVNYIVRGYINRNSILLNGKAYKFTIPVKQASQNKLIMETKLSFDKKEKDKLFSTIRNAYRKAPYYKSVEPLLNDIIYYDEDDLTNYIYHSVKLVMKYLGISTEILFSSKIEKDNTLKAQDRIVEICKKLETDVYINPCGGRSLYSQERFQQEKMQLYFLDTKMKEIVYNQGVEDFVSNLSMIDIMMFNDIEVIRAFLNKYELREI